MMRWGVVLLALVGCTAENPDLVLERQHMRLADATEAGWMRGSIILAGDANAFTFPQVVALRFTIVDDASLEAPTPQLIAQPQVSVVGGTATVSVAPVCQPMVCTAELRVEATDEANGEASAEAMFAIEANGPDGGARDCFYYAAVNASSDTDALRATLEDQQRECRLGAN